MKDEILKDISRIREEFLSEMNGVSGVDDARNLKVKFLGKKGSVTDLLKRLKDASSEDRPVIGSSINDLKKFVEEKCDGVLSNVEEKALQSSLEKSRVDITLPPRMTHPGRIHPLTKIMNELVGVFCDMGFSVYEGPEIETDFNNFEALNVPKDHPARDMQDTFYLNDELLLRTHTSPVQIRTMQKMKPPIFMIAPGQVYRRDTPDLTHSPIFRQVEGLMVDHRITFGDLKGVLTEFIHKVFGAGIGVRFRPSFFPFTEPSAEMEIACTMCAGKGCRVCKGSGWLEILGCGMVDPNVFKAVGYKAGEYTGFAFGMGVERIAMLKYGINDIRLFYENNIKFLEQF